MRVALIPARSGSKRAPGKNIRLLSGHPLLAYTVHAALLSREFDGVYVSTDSMEYAEIARSYGADTIARPADFATDASPDFFWVQHAAQTLGLRARDVFSILRPTSPLRTADTIRRAMTEFLDGGDRYDSLRAVEPVKQHPGKMWYASPGDWEEEGMRPVMNWWDAGTAYPAHSHPTQQLTPVYVQNASLEIARAEVLTLDKTISGPHIRPFFTQGYEGFDLNTEDDWLLLEALLAAGKVRLPALRAPSPAGAKAD